MILKERKTEDPLVNDQVHVNDNNVHSDYDPEENIELDDAKPKDDLHWKYFDEVSTKFCLNDYLFIKYVRYFPYKQLHKTLNIPGIYMYTVYIYLA